jgi:hypothetical protein
MLCMVDWLRPPGLAPTQGAPDEAVTLETAEPFTRRRVGEEAWAEDTARCEPRPAKGRA